MTRLFILILLLCSSVPLKAGKYYVSNSGLDQNNGRDSVGAWQHLSAVRGNVKSGDTVLLKRGDVFRESQAGWASNLYVADYGAASSPLPTISGAVAITGWSRYQGGPLYVADCPKKIAYLFVNDSLMPLARYPDSGWLRIDTVVENSDGTNTALTDAALTANPRNTANYWTGANIRWRRWSWWFETRTVVSYQAAGRLGLDGASFIHLTPCRDWGYYLDNKFEELNAPGEWFMDTVAKKVYLYPPGSADPAGLRVEGSVLSGGLDLSGLRIERVRFTMFTDAGLQISGTSTVNQCRFENIGSDSGGAALMANWEIQNAHITNCIFKNNFNLAIAWNENTAHTASVSFIEYDTLINTGCAPGYGGSGSWHAAGIIISNGRTVHIQYNVFKNTGYAGVILGSERNFVEYNIFDHAMATLNDGGAVYTDCSRSTIRHNIILNTEGNLVSSGPWSNLGHAVWPEFLGDFRENDIAYNTCAGSGGFGIFLPNNFADTLRGNVCYGNASAQLDLEGDSTNSETGRTQNLAQAHRIDSNICVATARGQGTLMFQPGFDYGEMSGNYFCNPWRGDSVIEHCGTGNQRWNTYWKTIPQWQAAYAWADAGAKTDRVKRPLSAPAGNPYGTTRLLINDSPAPKTVDLSHGSYRHLDGTPIATSVTIPPYYSVVVVCMDTAVSIVKNGSSGFTPFSARLLGARGRLLEFGCRLPESAEAWVELYGVDGRLIASVKKALLTPGAQVLRIKAPASGMLLWRMRIEGKNGREEKSGKAAVPAARRY